MSPITCSGMIYFVNHFPKNIKFHPSNPVTTTFQTGYNNYPNRIQQLSKPVTTTFQTGYNHFSNRLQPLFKLVTTTFQTGYNHFSDWLQQFIQTGYNNFSNRLQSPGYNHFPNQYDYPNIKICCWHILSRWNKHPFPPGFQPSIYHKLLSH